MCNYELSGPVTERIRLRKHRERTARHTIVALLVPSQARIVTEQKLLVSELRIVVNLGSQLVGLCPFPKNGPRSVSCYLGKSRS